MILPFFVLSGAVAGWNVGIRFGLVFGLLGVPIGGVLSIPVMGFTLAVVLGVVYLIERVKGSNGG